MQSYALSGFNSSILPFFSSSSCGAYTKFATETANLAITVAKHLVKRNCFPSFCVHFFVNSIEIGVRRLQVSLFFCIFAAE